MRRPPDSRQVVRRQYGDATKLNVRAGLHQRYGTNPHPWQEWVFDQLVLPGDARIVEVGCGPGDLWHANLDRVPAAWDVTLTDLSPGMLRNARGRVVRRASSGCRLAAADAGVLPFVRAQFDAVVANHMLYHVDDVDAVLAEVRRVLKPGGTFFAATVGLDHMHELFDVARDNSAAAAAVPAPNVAQFSLESGASQLAKRFVDVRLERYDNPIHVDAAPPLMDYLQSTEAGRAMSKGERTRCLHRYQSAIDGEGSFRITSATGLFVAGVP